MTLRELLIGRSLGRSLIRGLAIAALLLAGSRFVLVPIRAHGISMVPTYQEGQLLFANRLAYRVGRRLPWNILESQLGPDEIFVIGDNRSMLEKDHDFGRAPQSRILGRIIN
jgi:signal peptidase I